jgi:hypothetical protein
MTLYVQTAKPLTSMSQELKLEKGDVLMVSEDTGSIIRCEALVHNPFTVGVPGLVVLKADGRLIRLEDGMVLCQEPPTVQSDTITGSVM